MGKRSAGWAGIGWDGDIRTTFPRAGDGEGASRMSRLIGTGKEGVEDVGKIR